MLHKPIKPCSLTGAPKNTTAKWSKWANLWLRWPRCQKPSPISVLERWIHFALHGPMDDAQPQGFPEIPEHQELLKQRQPARSGEPFMTKRQKKHELNRVRLWNSNVFYTICGLKKVLKPFQRDSTAVSVFDHRHPIEHNFKLSSKTMAVATHEIYGWSKIPWDIGAHWSGPVGYSEVKHQKD